MASGRVLGHILGLKINDKSVEMLTKKDQNGRGFRFLGFEMCENVINRVKTGSVMS